MRNFVHRNTPEFEEVLSKYNPDLGDELRDGQVRVCYAKTSVKHVVVAVAVTSVCISQVFPLGAVRLEFAHSKLHVSHYTRSFHGACHHMVEKRGEPKFQPRQTELVQCFD